MEKTSKIKKLHLPLKKMDEKEKDYVAVVLEDINHNIKAFWEVLGDVKKKGEATFEEVGNIKGEIVVMNSRLNNIEGRLENIEQEVISIKNEIKDLKLSLSKKVDIERLETLELRIIKIEKHLNFVQY